MKRKLVFVLILLSYYSISIAQLKSKVSESFELISIVLDTIKIRFSEPMLGSQGMKPLDDEKIIYLPHKDMPCFKDPFTYIIIVNKAKIEAGKTYGFRLNGRALQSSR